MSILILILVAMAIVFEVMLIETGRIYYDRGYDEGLEDGIRMTNEVLEEDRKDEPQERSRE